MQREKLYNLHKIAFFIAALFSSKIVKISSGQISTVRKRCFFWYKMKSFFFLSSCFYHLISFIKKKQNTPQDAAWKALQFVKDSWFYSCTLCFQNWQNSQRPDFEAAKKSVFNTRPMHFCLIYYLIYFNFLK
jgi:hypothetical protein